MAGNQVFLGALEKWGPRAKLPSWDGAARKAQTGVTLLSVPVGSCPALGSQLWILPHQDSLAGLELLQRVRSQLLTEDDLAVPLGCSCTPPP